MYQHARGWRHDLATRRDDGGDDDDGWLDDGDGDWRRDADDPATRRDEDGWLADDDGGWPPHQFLWALEMWFPDPSLRRLWWCVCGWFFNKRGPLF